MTSRVDLSALSAAADTDVSRLQQFAADNGFVLGSHEGPVHYPGLIFTLGLSRRVPQHLLRGANESRGADQPDDADQPDGADQPGSGDQFLDIGNYEYVVSAGSSSFQYTYGFVAVRLNRMMPHIVLDSTRNDFAGISQLPVGYSRSQRLTLEGGFSKHFTLYCPKGYEQDALYIFTPDVMALFIDEAAAVDVEIIDDWIFFYRFGGFTLSDHATMQKLFRIVDTVGAKTSNRSRRYADTRTNSTAGQRMAVNRVAEQGARLKKAAPRSLIVGIVACAVIIGVAAAGSIVASIVTSIAS